MQIVKCKSQIDNLRFPILHFAFCILHYRSFSSIALLASASASWFISRGRYCTSTRPILAISSLALACSGFHNASFLQEAGILLKNYLDTEEADLTYDKGG
jgi:hypothetical protein